MSKQTGMVDPVDLKILGVLRDDARISMAALAATVGISRANAYTRVERLREVGVIEGFTIRVNHEKLGLDVTAISFLKVRQPARPLLTEPLRTIPGIEYAGFVTGEQDVIVMMRAPDVRTLRDDMMSRLSAEQPVQGLNTILVLDEIVNRPCVLPQP
jgi:Lrp/AsnC family transcriptional regulator, leucine-responsive regulatory protein